jgi:hypothetical protein
MESMDVLARGLNPFLWYFFCQLATAVTAAHPQVSAVHKEPASLELDSELASLGSRFMSLLTESACIKDNADMC